MIERIEQGGRAIRIRIRDHQPAALYIVALPDAAAAIELIRKRVAAPDDIVEHIARVSAELLHALKLGPGEFTRA